MVQCPSCGALVPDGRELCPNCGGRIPESISRAPVRPTVAAEPAYRYDNPDRAPDAVLSVGGFAGSLILLAIPGLGLLLMLLWSCGACRNHNRRNLARACLLLFLFVALVAAAAWFILKAIGVDPTALLPFSVLMGAK